MKTKLWLLLALAFVALFALSACGDDDDDNNVTGLPEVTESEFDWDIYFIEVEGGESARMYSVYADYLGNPGDLSQEDVYMMEIGDQMLELWGYEGSFYAHTELTAGQQYNVKFMKNSTVLSSADVRMPYQSSTAFPAVFDPSQDTSFSWSMQNSNQYQYAGADVFNWETEEDDEYIVVLNKEARSFTVPANALEDLGPDAEYSLFLGQLTFVEKGRFAFSSFYIDSKYYGEEYNTMSPLSKLNMARTLRRNL